MMMIINVKICWKDIFVEFQWTAFENKLTSVKKKGLLHATTLMYCKARQVLCNQLTNQENDSEMTFMPGATKIKSKVLKPSFDWMTWCRKQSEGINYKGMEDLVI